MAVLPKTMRAVLAPVPGGPEALALLDRPVPTPADGEVLIAVRAIGLNRADILQRMGKYPPPPGVTDILGLELAGEVAATGRGVTRYRLGDRVMALVSGGAYAEFAPVPEAVALPLPSGMSFMDGAAIPEAFFTVWFNLFELGRLKSGETALVHGGTSGIGTAAIQLARAKGARVFTTAGSDEKCDACRALGAAVAINYRTHDFVERIREATDGRGVDVVLDIIGGDYVARNHAAAASEGRIVQIATQQSPHADVDLRLLMAKRLSHTGSTLRPRDLAFKAALAKAVETNVLPLLTSGQVRAIVDSTFPLAAAADAHRRLESSAHIGKIVLTVA
jgi:putative PIG3 family NAD(P)H quinone oxidoreductase